MPKNQNHPAPSVRTLSKEDRVREEIRLSFEQWTKILGPEKARRQIMAALIAILLVWIRIERQFMNKEDATFRSRFEDAIERLNSRIDKIEETLSRQNGKHDQCDRGGMP